MQRMLLHFSDCDSCQMILSRCGRGSRGFCWPLLIIHFPDEKLLGDFLPIHNPLLSATFVCEHEGTLRSQKLLGRDVQRNVFFDGITHVRIEAPVVAAFGLDLARSLTYATERAPVLFAFETPVLSPVKT